MTLFYSILCIAVGLTRLFLKVYRTNKFIRYDKLSSVGWFVIAIGFLSFEHWVMLLGLTIVSFMELIKNWIILRS